MAERSAVAAFHGGNTPGPRAGGLRLGGEVEEVVLTQAAAGELDPDREAVVVDAEGRETAGWPVQLNSWVKHTSKNSASMASAIEVGRPG